MVAVALASSMSSGAAAAPAGHASVAAAPELEGSRPGHDTWPGTSGPAPAAGLLVAILLSLPLWGGIYALGRLAF